MSTFKALLGDQLILPGGKAVQTADALASKTTVCLYFSAHWCPPCRGFTPKLADKYKASSGDVEVVFVSSDQDQASFDEYHGSMPWLALPYSARKLKAKLSNKFEVQGIPSLIVLNGKTGALVTTEGRSEYETLFRPSSPRSVAANPPAPGEASTSSSSSAFVKMFGQQLLRGHRTVNTSEALGRQHKRIAVYFSAHWCPPCRRFTPALSALYQKAGGKDGETEVVFVSSDQDQKAFKAYFAEMPWLALPYSERDLKNKLSQEHGIRGIPTLLVFDGETGKLLTKDGRSQVEKLFTPSKPRKGVNTAVAAGSYLKQKEADGCGSVCAGCTVC